MKHFYVGAAAWDVRAKKAELFDPASNFLLVTGSLDSDCSDICGFVMWRFDVDETRDDPFAEPGDELIEVAYCILLHALESIAWQTCMRKVMLTVFKANKEAREFYHNQRYILDTTSPDNDEYECAQEEHGLSILQPVMDNSLKNVESANNTLLNSVALFSILDHFLRRDGSQSRVIGTLLGTRSESEVEVRSCFAVPHGESEDPWQIHLDAEHHRRMLGLHQRVRPEEVVLGWYSTSPDLNSNSALIQDHYSRETAPHQAVHLTLNTNVADKEDGLGVRTYVSSLLGATVRPDSCTFISVPTTLLTSSPEQTAMTHLANPASGESRTDLDALAASLEQVHSQLERVLTYLRKVLADEIPGDKAVGRFLSDTIGVVPAGVSSATLESLFNSHMQDIFMVSYLSKIISAQTEVSTRLALLT
ncbi:hypothetical protein MVES1_000609 [Malassezia vespertilionis]|uniref:uncharacterized protein n=1 Tax=Malassezia vespertilionis TaxID=2020962 RepID=UPI0024B27101|nr:uncharacterized protein MVES1_000609 [Malassezia vespertilionis]WFD05280.1 hypothetical protein MVES1_000609 [Malassezia vespertilionis]